MFIDLNPELLIANVSEVRAIAGVRNGCFSLDVVKDNGCENLLMYNKLGQLVYEIGNNKAYNCGVYLNNGHCLVGKVTTDDENKTHMSGVAYLRDVLSFEDAEVFSNDWFALKISGKYQLFNRNFFPVADGFSKALVFKTGYALCFDNESIWKLFTLDGSFFRTAQNVAGIVGNGNVLVRADDGTFKLENFRGEAIETKPIVEFSNYNDNCFVLTTDDGLSRMYDGHASRISVEVEKANTSFLPDGCFVYYEYDRKLISAIYQPTGILDRRPVYTFKTTENHYLIDAEFDHGRLFDAKGKELGKEFDLIKDKENFALFEQEGKAKLFNQFGQVFEATIVN